VGAFQSLLGVFKKKAKLQGFFFTQALQFIDLFLIKATYNQAEIKILEDMPCSFAAVRLYSSPAVGAGGAWVGAAAVFTVGAACPAVSPWCSPDYCSAPH
jgi:hypothetical protein